MHGQNAVTIVGALISASITTIATCLCHVYQLQASRKQREEQRIATLASHHEKYQKTLSAILEQIQPIFTELRTQAQETYNKILLLLQPYTKQKHRELTHITIDACNAFWKSIQENFEFQNGVYIKELFSQLIRFEEDHPDSEYARFTTQQLTQQQLDKIFQDAVNIVYLYWALLDNHRGLLNKSLTKILGCLKEAELEVPEYQLNQNLVLVSKFTATIAKIDILLHLTGREGLPPPEQFPPDNTSSRILYLAVVFFCLKRSPADPNLSFDPKEYDRRQANVTNNAFP